MTNTKNKEMEYLDENTVIASDADITEEDLELLGDKDEDMDGGDDELTESADLDDTDEDGDPLNEGSSKGHKMGSDLDVPGSHLDDADEDIGEEDEENNYYSEADNKD